MNGVIVPRNAWLVDKPDGVTELMLEGTCAGCDITAIIATTSPHGDQAGTRYTRQALEQMRDQLLAQAIQKKEPSPAFRCENCGEEGYFVGTFSPSRYEQQLAAWNQKHKRCPPIFNGGMI